MRNKFQRENFERENLVLWFYSKKKKKKLKAMFKCLYW